MLRSNCDTCADMKSPIDLDWAAALERVGGDEELLREITAIFLEDYPNLITEIRAAIAAQDHKRLEAAAHTLKGSVANFGAPEAVAAAYRLEMLGRTHELIEAPAAFRVLEAQFSFLHPALERFKQS